MRYLESVRIRWHSPESNRDAYAMSMRRLGVPLAALVFDLSLLGAAAQIFVKLRRDEETRRYMHTQFPLLLKGKL